MKNTTKLLRHFYALKLPLSILLLVSLLNSNGINAQTIYNANGQPISFLAARKVHKTGTDGTAAGNITLYTNVITINSQAIDCIVKTVSLNNCTFALPQGASGGTIPFDYSATSATYLSGNNDSFFAPMMNFTAAGYVEFQFEFILGGSYNNGTNTGTTVILQNVFANSYDIDGAGSGTSYQFTEFGGFIQSTLGTGGNIATSYNNTTSLTKFQSTVSTNQTDIKGDAHRIKVKYEYLSKLNFTFGQTGSGVAYFFMDMGPGSNWAANPTTFNVIALDLSTDSAGQNYGPFYCSGNKRLTQGTTNITNSTNAITEIVMTYDTSKLLNGTSESFIIMKNGGRDTIKLKYTANGTQNFTFNSTTFTITKSFLAGGLAKLSFVKNGGGTLATSLIEALFDSIYYNNLGSTSGIRSFEISIQEGVYTSNSAIYNLRLDCAALPVELIRFDGKTINREVELFWSTASELNNSHFEIYRSENGVSWTKIGELIGNGTTQQRQQYQFIDHKPFNLNYYRLRQVDFDGQYEFTHVIQVKMEAT